MSRPSISKRTSRSFCFCFFRIVSNPCGGRARGGERGRGTEARAARAAPSVLRRAFGGRKRPARELAELPPAPPAHRNHPHPRAVGGAATLRTRAHPPSRSGPPGELVGGDKQRRTAPPRARVSTAALRRRAAGSCSARLQNLLLQLRPQLRRSSGAALRPQSTAAAERSIGLLQSSCGCSSATQLRPPTSQLFSLKPRVLASQLRRVAWGELPSCSRCSSLQLPAAALQGQAQQLQRSSFCFCGRSCGAPSCSRAAAAAAAGILQAAAAAAAARAQRMPAYGRRAAYGGTLTDSGIRKSSR